MYSYCAKEEPNPNYYVNTRARQKETQNIATFLSSPFFRRQELVQKRRSEWL